MIASEKGIYTLANDVVYDQLVALVNSIRRNYSETIPICVIPYDDNLDKVKEYISRQKKIFLFEDKKCIRFIENYILDLNESRKEYFQKNGLSKKYRLGHYRSICSLYGPFESFLFLDADVLLFSNIDFIFDKLEHFDYVVYDFQFKDFWHVYNKESDILKKYDYRKIKKYIFCSGFFASSKNVISKNTFTQVLRTLKKHPCILYPFASDQTVLNYIFLEKKLKGYNFALNLPKNKITGNCVVSKHFKQKNFVLYDKRVRLTYLHYIGIPAKQIADVCKGKIWKRFPYKWIFLYYRFLAK